MSNDQRPAILVREWAALQQPPVPERTAKAWAAAGHIPAWQSLGTWLIRPDEPHPGPMPTGAAAHKPKG